MHIVSYDIQNNKIRTNFSKMLRKNGAIRLQMSVYEINNSNRIIDVLLLKIDQFSKYFTGADSVIIFDVNSIKLRKYGNAIHRDEDVVFL